MNVKDMHYATQNLEDDHIYILRLIEVMESMTKNPIPEIVHLEEAVNLIKNYADFIARIIGLEQSYLRISKI